MNMHARKKKKNKLAAAAASRHYYYYTILAGGLPFKPNQIVCRGQSIIYFLLNSPKE